MLPRHVKMQADCFFDALDIVLNHFSLLHMLDGLHHQTCMSNLFGAQSLQKDWIDLVGDLSFIQLRVNHFQVFAHCVE